MNVFLSLPFTVDATGAISTFTDPVVRYANEIRMVIGTYFGERVMRSEYGCGVFDYLYEGEAIMESVVEPLIREAVASSVSGVTINSVTVSTENIGSAAIDVSVEFTVDAIGKSGSTSVHLGVQTPAQFIEVS